MICDQIKNNVMLMEQNIFYGLNQNMCYLFGIIIDQRWCPQTHFNDGFFSAQQLLMIFSISQEFRFQETKLKPLFTLLF